MSATEVHISERAAELRQTFDRSFVEAQHVEAVATEDFLAIHVGGDPYVLRLAEIGGLFVDKSITELPSRVAELKGIAGFRGAMLPVYDLAALLGYPRANATRWMVRAAGAPVALAFDSFDGHFRFSRDAVASHGDSSSSEHIHEIVRADNRTRSIIHLPSVIAAIRKRAPEVALNKEH
jgi:chemotaxis signal transduction protein